MVVRLQVERKPIYYVANSLPILFSRCNIVLFRTNVVCYISFIIFSESFHSEEWQWLAALEEDDLWRPILSSWILAYGRKIKKPLKRDDQYIMESIRFETNFCLGQSVTLVFWLKPLISGVGSLFIWGWIGVGPPVVITAGMVTRKGPPSRSWRVLLLLVVVVVGNGDSVEKD